MKKFSIRKSVLLATSIIVVSLTAFSMGCAKDANNKFDDSYISNILDHTANLLQDTNILLSYFSVFVIIASLVMTFLGLKLIREHHIVKQNIQRLKENSLDNLLTIAVSIPLLSSIKLSLDQCYKKWRAKK